MVTIYFIKMKKNKTILITGGAGFIGANLVHYLIDHTSHTVVNIDKLTYAGHLESLELVERDDRYSFFQRDINDVEEIRSIINEVKPDGIMHLAAESHVDRSIDGPGAFLQTNIIGTYNLLEVARDYYETLEEDKKNEFRFLHVSTDEVFGSLGTEGYFTEETPYDPRSPYSASKASSDHIVRAWHHTYEFPVLITNCSNNYGPYQFPEKLLPVVILKALNGDPIPVYGKGENVRDWLYVEDHAKALVKVMDDGRLGHTYNIGGNNEKQNIEVVETICRILDDIKPQTGKSYKDQITFVKDRPGHDMRYAIDATKIKNDLGWVPEETFETGLRKTVQWYLDNLDWCRAVTNNNYNFERQGVI